MNSSFRLICVACLLALVLRAGARGEEFRVADPNDVQDVALLDGEFGGWNFGGSPLLEVGYMGGIYAEHHAASLLRFDLSGVACRTVQSAKLRLYKPKDFIQTRDLTVAVYETLATEADWSEGSAACAVDEAGATWRAKTRGKPWERAMPGALMAGKRLGSARAAADRGQWLEFDLPASLVQRWLDDPHSNDGVVLGLVEPAKEWGDHVYLFSSESFRSNTPQLVISGVAGRSVATTTASSSKNKPREPYVLPALDARFDQWLTGKGRLAQFAADCSMNREQARVFWWFDTTVRKQLIVGRYQGPLQATFVELQKLIERSDEAAVREKLQGVRDALLTWEFIRETSWYTSGPLADVLTPRQLATLFAKSIFGGMETRAERDGKGKLIRAGKDPREYEGIWQPLSGEKLEAHVRRTIDQTAEQLGLTPQQRDAMAPKIAEYEREENRYLALFRRDLDHVRALLDKPADANAAERELFDAVKSMHRNHELFLYYQSIYDTPRWTLFRQQAPPIGLAKWVVQTRERSSRSAAVEEERENGRALDEREKNGGK